MAELLSCPFWRSFKFFRITATFSAAWHYVWPISAGGFFGNYSEQRIAYLAYGAYLGRISVGRILAASIFGPLKGAVKFKRKFCFFCMAEVWAASHLAGFWRLFEHNLGVKIIWRGSRIIYYLFDILRFPFRIILPNCSYVLFLAFFFSLYCSISADF